MNDADIAECLVGIRQLLDSPRSASEARMAYGTAVERCRSALQSIDSAASPAAALDIALLHLEALRMGADLGAPSDKEAALRRADAHVQAALHLARVLGRADRLARVHEQACLIASERYLPDRDEALFDAIAHADVAAGLWRRHEPAREFDLPRVLMQKGNCAMKIRHERQRSFDMAVNAYADAAGFIGPGTPERLATLLKQNVDFAASRQIAGIGDLPELERVNRFGTQVQQALDRGDPQRAAAIGWAFLAWSWSVEPAPNRHTGEAHQLLAKLAFNRGDAEGGRDQQYQAVAVFAFLVRRKQLPDGVFEGASAVLRQIVAREGRDEAQQQAYVEMAAGGLERAMALGEQVPATIQQDPRAAVATLDLAQRHFPNWPVLMFYDGVARSLTGDPQGALAAYDRYLAFMPRSARALMNRAHLKLNLADPDGAKADIEAARAIVPDDPALLALTRRLDDASPSTPASASDTAD